MPRTPGANAEATAERIMQVMELIGNGWEEPKMRKALAPKWAVSKSTVTKYIVRARKEIGASVKLTKEEKCAEIIHGLKTMIASTTTPANVKLGAWKELSKIYGARAPREINLNTPQIDAQELMDAANKTEEGREAARLGAAAIVKVSEERMQRMEPGRN